MHTDKVPSSMPDHRIEDRCRDLFNTRPALAERFSERIQIIRKDTTTAQEYGMHFHSRTLLDGKCACGSTEEVGPSMDAMEGLDDDCTELKSSAKSDGFALIASGSTGAITGASDWLNGRFS